MSDDKLEDWPDVDPVTELSNTIAQLTADLTAARAELANVNEELELVSSQRDALGKDADRLEKELAELREKVKAFVRADRVLENVRMLGAYSPDAMEGYQAALAALRSALPKEGV